jgi:cytochrome c oxidase accessory protein FixG
MITTTREKTYPRSVKGKFRTLRWVISACILGTYLIIPWLSVGGRAALLIDIPGRKFYIFGLIIWPQEVYYLVFFLLFLVIMLFFVTAIAGRIWCGYGCPQTIFTDIFVTIERFVDGDRNSMIRLANAPLSFGKVVKRVIKHSLWLIVSFIVGFTFVAYFVHAPELFSRLVTGTLTSTNMFWIASVMFFLYIDCAFIRELMCLIPCPYGRFQTALFDSGTLIIGYDEKRGEPRSEHLKDAKEGEFGDCIDCTLCVQVCPTGIDIREGLQCECIACADCIDACNTVMKKLGRPANLIKYSSLDMLKGEKARIVRPRVFVYSLMLLLLAGIFVYSLATRSPMGLDILRDRSALYYKGVSGDISNLYIIKALNKDTVERTYQLSVEGLEAELIFSANPFTLASGEVYESKVVLKARRKAGDYGIRRFNFVIADVEDGRRELQESTFFFPESD